MRKQPIETWQIEDAKRLLDLFQRWQRNQPKKVSQDEFGASCQIGTQGMVWQYLNAHRPLNHSAAQRFAAGLNVAIDDFSPHLADEIRTMARFVKESETALSPPALALAARWQRLGPPARTAVLQVLEAWERIPGNHLAPVPDARVAASYGQPEAAPEGPRPRGRRR